MIFSSELDGPTAGATVTLSGGIESKTATADATGRYEILGLGAGTYQLRFFDEDSGRMMCQRSDGIEVAVAEDSSDSLEIDILIE